MYRAAPNVNDALKALRRPFWITPREYDRPAANLFSTALRI